MYKFETMYNLVKCHTSIIQLSQCHMIWTINKCMEFNDVSLVFFKNLSKFITLHNRRGTPTSSGIALHFFRIVELKLNEQKMNYISVAMLQNNKYSVDKQFSYNVFVLQLAALDTWTIFNNLHIIKLYMNVSHYLKANYERILRDKYFKYVGI